MRHHRLLSTLAIACMAGACSVADNTFVGPDRAAPAPRCAKLRLPSVPWPEVSRAPRVVASADLDRNGTPDLVIANADRVHVRVLLGNGDGTFQRAVEYPVTGGVNAIAIVDVNGDALVDVVTSNVSGAMNVLTGNGDGSLREALASQSTTEAGAAILAVGDLNGDRFPDAITATPAGLNAGGINVLLGTSDFRFGNRIKYPTANPSSIVIADLDGRAGADVIVTNSSDNTISVLANNGDGTFKSPVNPNIEGSPVSAAAADFDSDGVLEVVVASRAALISVYRVFIDTGDRPSLDWLRDLRGLDDLRAITTADLNGDGNPDLLAARGANSPDAPGLLSVSLGNGDERITFGDWSDYQVGNRPSAISVADIDGDHQLDVLVANEGNSSVSVLLGTRAGVLRAPARYATDGNITAIAAGDLTGDGLVDFVTAHYDADKVNVMREDDQHGFSRTADPTTGDQPRALVLADLDGDRVPDVVTANLMANTVSVMFSDHLGGVRSVVSFPTDPQPNDVAAADIDGDGDNDLIVRTLPGKLSVLRGGGLGSFAAPDSLSACPGGWVAAGDLDGDGDIDLAASCGIAGTVDLLLNDGRGSFAPPLAISTGVATSSISLPDLDGDHRADIVAIHSQDDLSQLAVLRGNQDGTFQPAMLYPAGQLALEHAVADIDGDGALDVAIIDFRAQAARVRLGDGAGGFSDELVFDAGPRPTALTLADVTGDGLLDTAVGNRDGGITILPTTCAP